MKKHTTGSVSRQAQRRANKRRRQAERERRQRARPSWPRVKAGRLSREPQAQPQARGYLVRQFWEHLRLGELLHQAGVKQKFKGLPAVTLMLVALMFGVFNAGSVSDLAAQAAVDPVLLEACWVQGLERKQLYRFLSQVRDTTRLRRGVAGRHRARTEPRPAHCHAPSRRGHWRRHDRVQVGQTHAVRDVGLQVERATVRAGKHHCVGALRGLAQGYPVVL